MNSLKANILKSRWILNEKSYLDIPNQTKKTFKYVDSKKTMKSKWLTNPANTSLKTRGTEIY